MGEQLWKELHRVGWQQWTLAGEPLLSLRAEGVWGVFAAGSIRKKGSEISAETLRSPTNGSNYCNRRKKQQKEQQKIQIKLQI